MPGSAPPLGLVLAGGGARCAYQAGALKAISEILPAARNPFHVIVGQSAGAINAACLACRAGGFASAAGRLADIWARLRADDAFRTDAASIGCRGLLWVLMAASGGWLVRNPRSFLDNRPLAELLAREVDFDAIQTGDLRTNIQVYGGDIIYVEPTILAKIGYAIQQVLFPITPFFGVAATATRF